MSVDQTENKNSRKGLAQVGYCLKYLMNFLKKRDMVVAGSGRCARII